MAKIIKVGSHNPTFTSKQNKAADLAKNSRMGNPFKYVNFEGNALPFADVFEGFQPSFKGNKLKMVATSVTGSMTKMRTGLTESITNFVNRVRGGVSHAIEYISDIPAIKQTKDFLLAERHLPSINIKPIEGLSSRLAGIKGSFNSTVDFLNKDILDIGKDMKSQWDNLIAKIPSRTRYTAETPVAELEAAWRELALGGV